MLLTVDTESAVTTATSGTAATSSLVMLATATYLLTASANLWYSQAATPTASAGGAGCCYLAAGTSAMLDGKLGAHLSVIQDTAAGKAVLVRVTRF